MQRYIYSYKLEEQGGETVLQVPKLPGLVSHLDTRVFARMSKEQVQDFVTDAVVVTLQGVMACREDIPPGDDRQGAQDSGAIVLTVQQSIKLELYKLYRAEFRSVAQFARHLGKMETTVRRMLDLRHRSSVAEIEEVIEMLGRRLVVAWDTEVIGPTKHTARLHARSEAA